MPSTLTLEESARRLGHARWIELQLFEALGGWVHDVRQPWLKRYLAEHSAQAAWHADLFEGRLPALAHLDAASLTTPASEGVRSAITALREPTGDDPTIERLVGAYRVLIPRRIAECTLHRNHTSAITDGPTARVLSLVLHDHLQAWQVGELMLQALITDAGGVARAAAHQARLEQLLIS